MNPKVKKALLITGIVIDVGATVFLLVLSIIMLAKTVGDPNNIAPGLIGYFQKNPLVYGLTCVVPLFVLLAINIVGLVIYVRKSSKKEPVAVNDLTDEQKEALRKELLKELAGESENKSESQE